MNDREPDAFEAIRKRADQGPYFVDTCHGMVGGPAVLGPSGITGFMQGEENQRKAEQLARDRNVIWACGYEAALRASEAEVESLRKERDEAKREMERRGQAIADAMGRYRGHEPLIEAVARLSGNFHAAHAEATKAEVDALLWAATQVCRWYDETRCRERACPCVPIQDRVAAIRAHRPAEEE